MTEFSEEHKHLIVITNVNHCKVQCLTLIVMLQLKINTTSEALKETRRRGGRGFSLSHVINEKLIIVTMVLSCNTIQPIKTGFYFAEKYVL